MICQNVIILNNSGIGPGLNRMSLGQHLAIGRGDVPPCLPSKHLPGVQLPAIFLRHQNKMLQHT